LDWRTPKASRHQNGEKAAAVQQFHFIKLRPMRMDELRGRMALHKMQWPGFCATTRNCACAGFPGRLHLHGFPPKSSLQKNERTVIRSVQTQLPQAKRWPRPFFIHSLSP
jgi:hypothetical protein